MNELAPQEQYIADFRQALSVDSASIAGASPEEIATICNSKWDAAGDGYRFANEAKARAALTILEFGYCLTKAKSELPHGTFTEWVKETQHCKPRYAQYAMKAWVLGAELFAEKKKTESLPSGVDISDLVQDVMHPDKKSTTTDVVEKRSIAAFLADAKENGELDEQQTQEILTLLGGNHVAAENDDQSQAGSSGGGEPAKGDTDSGKDKKTDETSTANAGSSSASGQAGGEGTIIDVDPHGQPVPEHLRFILGDGRDIIIAVQGQLKHLYSACNKLAKDNPDLFAYFRRDPFRAAYKNLAAEMNLWVPEAVCAYCAGVESEQCTACGGYGFANPMRWRTTADEFKPRTETKKTTKKAAKKKVAKKTAKKKTSKRKTSKQQ